MIATAPAKPQNSFLLEGRGLILFLVFLLALVGLIIFGASYNSSTHYSAASGTPLTITGAPGETVFITINAGNSINGLWASSGGISFSVSSFSTPAIGIAAPKDPSWSDSIETDSKSTDDPINISTSLVIPTPSNPSMTTITGQISGDISYPDESFYGSFEDKSTNVSIPVRIILIPASTVFVSEQLPLYVATGLGILLLLAVPLACRVYDNQRRRNNPVLW